MLELVYIWMHTVQMLHLHLQKQFIFLVIMVSSVKIIAIFLHFFQSFLFI